MKNYLLICILSLIFCLAAGADTVILNSGDKFTTQKAWEENGKIKFYMQGLIVSVPKKDVRQIVTGSTGDNPLNAEKSNEVKSSPPPTINNATKTIVKTDKSPTVGKKIAAASPVQKSSPVESSLRPPQKPAGKDPSAGRNDKIDFRGLQWGIQANGITGLKKKGTVDLYGGIDEYYHPDDPLVIGKTSVDGVIFGFWQGRLYTITIWADGYSQYRKLKSEAFERYGIGIQNKPEKERFVWYGDTTDKLLEFDDKSKAGILWMRSSVLDNQRRELFPD